MTGPESLRVFIDAHGVDVPRGSTALDAVSAYDANAANSLRSGEKILTDSRGLPTDPSVAVESGAIFRLIPRRDRTSPPKPN